MAPSSGVGEEFGADAFSLKIETSFYPCYHPRFDVTHRLKRPVIPNPAIGVEATKAATDERSNGYIYTARKRFGQLCRKAIGGITNDSFPFICQWSIAGHLFLVVAMPENHCNSLSHLVPPSNVANVQI